LIGSQGNDLINGGQGADIAFSGAGDDTFVWNPGDGSDVFEGQDGQDTLLFNGANIAEKVDISANGQRLRFFRDIATITMDCNGVEVVQFNALGGADTITVNDLSGTSVTQVNLDLASPPTSGIGDNQPDTVIVTGTEGDDVATITGTAAGVSVLGFSGAVNIVGTDPSMDQLIIRMLGGDDVMGAQDLQDGALKLTADGGPGDDVLIGSQGADVLLGGQGDDVLEGGPGLDVLDGGPGANVLIQD
jgi:Ca2+-binding RTX toxin-like protein